MTRWWRMWRSWLAKHPRTMLYLVAVVTVNLILNVIQVVAK